MHLYNLKEPNTSSKRPNLISAFLAAAVAVQEAQRESANYRTLRQYKELFAVANAASFVLEGQS
jgi:hypothetical protein